MNLRNTLIASSLTLGIALGGVSLATTGPAGALAPLPGGGVVDPCALTAQGCNPPAGGIPIVSIPPGATIPPLTTVPPIVTVPPKINPCVLLPAGCQPPATTPDPRDPGEPGDPGDPGDPGNTPTDTPVRARPTFTG